MPMNLLEKSWLMNNKKLGLGYILIYSITQELIICLLLKRLQLLFQRKDFIMQ